MEPEGLFSVPSQHTHTHTHTHQHLGIKHTVQCSLHTSSTRGLKMRQEGQKRNGKRNEIKGRVLLMKKRQRQDS